MLTNNIDQKYDVAILGSGPAGMTTALELSKNKALKILIIESGTFTTRQIVNSLSQLQVQGDLDQGYYSLHSQRLIGGTSSVWSGLCTELEKKSFLEKKWPLNFSEIQKYYPAAATILDLPKESFKKPYTLINEDAPFQYRPYYLSPPTRFGQKYKYLFEKNENIDLLPLHTCTEIVHKNNKISHLRVKSIHPINRSDKSIFAKNYILAAGGIANATLLQRSNIASECPVGKYFMEHPHILYLAELELDRERLSQVLYKSNQYKALHAIQFTDQFCIENNLPSFTIGFSTDKIQRTALLGKKKPIFRSTVHMRAEMNPDPRNKVFIKRDETELDIFKQKKASVNFHFKYRDIMKKNWEVFATELLKSGLGRATTMKKKLPIIGGGHIMGTTRMGEDMKTSVIDKNCKVHGIDNLYVAGSSIFPAGGAANPTFSIVAFSLRLGVYLRGQL